MITNDRRLRTRPAEAELAIAHRLRVVHLHGEVGSQPPWNQLVRVATRWSNIADQQAKAGPWWLSLRTRPPISHGLRTRGCRVMSPSQQPSTDQAAGLLVLRSLRFAENSC